MLDGGSRLLAKTEQRHCREARKFHVWRRSNKQLLYLLDKDEQEDLDDDQRKALRKMVADLKKH